MSIVPTTERDGPSRLVCRASVTRRSNNSLTLRTPAALDRAFSHVMLSVSNVTEIACFGMIYDNYRISWHHRLSNGFFGLTASTLSIVEGAQGLRSVRSCLILSETVAGPYRQLRILVDLRKAEDAQLADSRLTRQSALEWPS
jgi:hypothetical protein